MHPLHDPVAAMMREVAETIMMPRHRRLAADEVMQKGPDDPVTIVDRESEALFTARLPVLLPGSRVVGEEACAADERLIETLGDGVVWIVDPLDGTSNFAAGEGAFGIMVALAEGGVVQAGWVYDPVRKRMCHAALGGGAFVDGARVGTPASGGEPPVAALATKYLPEAKRPLVAAAVAGKLAEVPVPGCAAEQYPRVALGENDIALFWRTLPWDHAPGALFLEEAGGRVAYLDGGAYRVTERRAGMIAAASPALWDYAAALIAPALR
ncbi:MAG: inositol monophosphatase family protein [Sphingomonadaceae bacterium]|nr:inositol monophosphatase family protein [Sphingomonadaceae bacterium]